MIALSAGGKSCKGLKISGDVLGPSGLGGQFHAFDTVVVVAMMHIIDVRFPGVAA